MRGGDASTTALLVIDFQNDFCTGGSLAVKDADNILPEVQKLSELAKGWKLRVATQDYHPIDHVSFASNNPGTDRFTLKDITVKGKAIKQMMWPNHCVQESPGAEFFPGFDTTGYENIKKGTVKEVDSYSGFGDGLTERGKTKEMEDTGLKALLEKNGIKHVVVCGIATDYCVAATCMDAAAYGFQVTLVLKASAGVTAEGIAKAVQEMEAAGVSIVDDSTKVTDEENMA
jgi:nicotinamidase/pyrazinamidase